jgi:aspartate racemase
LEYYRIINEEIKDRLGGFHSAKCIMYSFDFDEIVLLQQQNKWEQLTNKMIEAGQRLNISGADFIVMCSNTMHIMAHDIESNTGIRVLHIAEAAGEKILQRGMKKVGLIGTKFTMEGNFFKKVLKDKYNIEVVIPEDDDREIIHNVIYNELCKGQINMASKEKFINIINNLALKDIEGVILGCTEMPLLIGQEDVKIEIFDSTRIHAVKAVSLALKDYEPLKPGRLIKK